MKAALASIPPQGFPDFDAVRAMSAEAPGTIAVRGAKLACRPCARRFSENGTAISIDVGDIAMVKGRRQYI